MGQCSDCGLIQLVNPAPAKELLPPYDWITYSEPEGHLDDLVDKITSLSGINKDSTFLGISFVGLMIYAGFTWMLAGGNKEKVTKATSIIRGAVIGLAMVLAAYAITTFIYQSFLTRIN